MREIKFRYFNKLKEKMEDFRGMPMLIEELESISEREDMPVMQYTGLKDKNGVEIYEGDILTSRQYPFQDDGEYNYHGVVEWIDYLASFYITKRLVNKDKRGISDGISEQIENINKFEVIGNIYENPEWFLND